MVLFIISFVITLFIMSFDFFMNVLVPFLNSIKSGDAAISANLATLTTEVATLTTQVAGLTPWTTDQTAQATAALTPVV